jgi:UPF0755 protein
MASGDAALPPDGTPPLSDDLDRKGAFGREAEESTRPAPARTGPGPARRVVQVRRPPRPGARRAAIVSVVVVLVLAGAALAVWAVLFRPVVDVSPGQSVQVDVPKGATNAELGELLAQQGVVANPLMFRVQARLLGAGGKIKAGVYDFVTGATYRDVIDRLEAGSPVVYHKLTVPEGWTIDQTAKRVEEQAGVPAKEFADLARTGAGQFHYSFLSSNGTESLEGYLFPKTYLIRQGSGAKEIIDVMLRQFDKEAAGLDLSHARSRGLTMHDVVKIASMIERETKVQSDRPLVSSVIYNRLARNMFLEIDATVQYAVGGKPRLLYRDLRVDSPYNTYRNKGLPPGPIANPGLASLKAACAPARTGYLWYVLTHRNGTHSFAETKVKFEALKARAKKGLK